MGTKSVKPDAKDIGAEVRGRDRCWSFFKALIRDVLSSVVRRKIEK